MRTFNKPTEKEINDVLAGIATPEQAQCVAKWFHTDEGQKYISETITNQDANIKLGNEYLYVNHEICSEKMKREIHKRIKSQRVRSAFLYAASIAAILLLSISYLTFNHFSKSMYEEVYCQSGEQQVVFSDGTVAILASNTKIRYRREFSDEKRVVHLLGEVYFDVKSDRGRPFIIELNNSSIEVIGTAFNVEAYNDRNFVVKVDEGVVNVSLPTGEKKIVEAGESIEYDIITKESIVSNESILMFDNETLRGIIDKMESIFDVKFVVENPNVLHNTFTFKFEEPTLESILNDIERITPVRFDVKTVDNRTVIEVR